MIKLSENILEDLKTENSINKNMYGRYKLLKLHYDIEVIDKVLIINKPIPVKDFMIVKEVYRWLGYNFKDIEVGNLI